jgi:hypothetical protein
MMSFDWHKIPIPLGFTVAALVALFGLWGWLHAEFVLAQEYQEYKQTVEIRGLERDKRQAETEVMKLELKQSVYPKKFDEIDRQLLKKQRIDLLGVKADLKDAKIKSAK